MKADCVNSQQLGLVCRNGRSVRASADWLQSDHGGGQCVATNAANKRGGVTRPGREDRWTGGRLARQQGVERVADVSRPYWLLRTKKRTVKNVTTVLASPAPGPRVTIYNFIIRLYCTWREPLGRKD